MATEKSPPWILAIDPGISGGLATRCLRTGAVEAYRMPTKGLRSIQLLIDKLAERPNCHKIILEKVWGRNTDSKRAMTTFMRHTGFLIGCLYGSFPTAEDLIVEVPPTVWQRALDCPKTSRDKAVKAHKRKTAHKNALKAMAIELYPEIPKVTLATADALLLATYGVKECSPLS